MSFWAKTSISLIILLTIVTALFLSVNLVQKSQRLKVPAQTISLISDTPVERTVFLLVFNPVIESQGGKKLTEYKSWFDPYVLTNQVTAKFPTITHNYLTYRIAGQQEVDGYPVKPDGFVYTDSTYLGCLNNTSTCHQPDIIDYQLLFNTYNLCQKNVDEIWLWGGPYFGYWEFHPVTYCGKTQFVMGFNYERALDQVFHDFGHRMEFVGIKRVGDNVWDQNENDEWSKYSLVNGHCGSVHYPPGTIIGQEEYKYNKTAFTNSDCDSYLNYPTGPFTARSINCQVWGCTHLGYQEWWLSHIPANPGAVTINGKTIYNNWWKAYVYYDETATPLVSSPSCPYVSTQIQVQKDSTDPWGDSKSINLGQSVQFGAFHNGTGFFAGSSNNSYSPNVADADIFVRHPNGQTVVLRPPYPILYIPDQLGRYNFIGLTRVAVNDLNRGYNTYPACIDTGFIDVSGSGTVITPTPTSTPTTTPTSFPIIIIEGDANSDGRVDGLDYVIWLNNYGRTAAGGPGVGDFNRDGRVDGLDYVVWLNNYGRTANTPTSVPTLISTFTPTPTSGVTGTVTTLRFVPTHDSFTNDSLSNQNNGSSSRLEVDGVPNKYIWLRFNTGVITGTIVNARVRLNNIDPSPSGGDIYYTSNDGWDESIITWSNQPAITGITPLFSQGAVAIGSWYRWDVTSVINNTEAHYTFVFKSTNSDGADYNSKEVNTKEPELIIDVIR